jgi:GWxTD domain-containing protein
MRNLRHRALLVRILLTFFLMSGFAFAQDENVESRKFDRPEFYVDALSFSGDTLGSRLDVYLQLPFDQLHFLKEGDVFGAKYEVTMTLFSSDDARVAEKNWLEDVKATTFDESVAKGKYSLAERSFYLQPAKYKLRVRIRETESDKTSEMERSVQVPNFNRDISLSDVMIVNKLTEEGGKKSIVPNVSDNVGQLPHGFYLFFEIYNRTNLDSLELLYSIRDPARRVEVATFSEVMPVAGGRTEHFFKIDSLDIPVGSYNLTVEARRVEGAQKESDEELSPVASVEKAFTLRWAGMPLTLTSLDLAIDQLRYIAKGNELDSIKSAPTLQEKQKRFREFWKRRDPTPGTEENEIMVEYYSRVAYANKHFSHFIDGWKTDMGMVYIILGPPDNVDRHPFEYNSKPYEVWDYYDRNRRFVFVDETGFGDYRLTTPVGDILQRY